MPRIAALKLGICQERLRITCKRRQVMSDHKQKNIILYGPPGTGKTYAAIRRAVNICDNSILDKENEIRDAYRRLVDEGQIRFVTFHQSMSYEEFIEGLRPETEKVNSENDTAQGFRLKNVPGIFKCFAQEATENVKQSKRNEPIHTKRNIFKISIGSNNNPKDKNLFREAINNDCAMIDVEDIDFSDESYSDTKKIASEIRNKSQKDPGGKAGIVHRFRNVAKKGDIVVASQGNRRFRAIGILTGDYEYHPRKASGYSHRRSVKWYWSTFEQGLRVDEVYEKNFIQNAMYKLDYDAVIISKIRELTELDIVSEEILLQKFVLIIDEINRANISKVFGEVITLMEPDKREGEVNEIKVILPYSNDEFGVPSNLYIIGTMNTADRSIANIDTALRRRFKFEEMMPKPEDLGKIEGIDLNSVLEVINERIECLYDREHQVGHAYFLSCRSKEDIDETMRYKVIPLLADYFFDDWSKIATVLGDHDIKDGEETSGGFLKRSTIRAPSSFEGGDETTSVRWKVRSKDEGFTYNKLVRKSY